MEHLNFARTFWQIFDYEHMLNAWRCNGSSKIWASKVTNWCFISWLRSCSQIVFLIQFDLNIAMLPWTPVVKQFRNLRAFISYFQHVNTCYWENMFLQSFPICHDFIGKTFYCQIHFSSVPLGKLVIFVSIPFL